jgi:hypothetical protein
MKPVGYHKTFGQWRPGVSSASSFVSTMIQDEDITLYLYSDHFAKWPMYPFPKWIQII